MRWLIVLWCFAALMLAGCTRGTQKADEPIFAENEAVAAAPSVEDAGYAIATGDFVSVKSASRPEVNCVGRVREDGTAALNVVGYVRAAGSTTAQFAETLNDLYKEVEGYEAGVADLTIEVKLGLYLVTGEITSGGFRTYADGLTIYDAVVSGGKFTGKALEDRIFLNRKGADGREIIRYSNLEQLKELPLKENDWVVIPYKVDFLLH